MAINNQGHVLGSAAPLVQDPWNFPALHDGNGVYRLSDLIPPGSGWIMNAAVDINDRDQIVGWGIDPQGEARGFLLEPAPNTGPFYWLLAGMVLTGLGQAVGRSRLRR